MKRTPPGMLRVLRSISVVSSLVAAACFVPGCMIPGGDDVAVGGAAAITGAELSAATELSLPKRLPTTPDLDAWYSSVAQLETAIASGDPRFELVPNRGGGTSAYVQVKRDGKVIGAFLPENSATVPLGEVRAFQIARAVGVADNVGAGVFFRMRGAGLARLKSVMESEKYADAKELNRKAIVSRLATNPPSLLGVFKDWTTGRPFDYEALVNPSAAPNGSIDESDPIARLLRSGARQPSADKVGLKAVAGATAPEVDLARQLSTLMLIDALNGQWDRFSGGNMHAMTRDGGVRFVTLDNGGITTSAVGLALRYRELITQKWVTRFDRSVADRFVAMNEFVKGATPAFLGFATPLQLRDAMMMTTDKEWNGFSANLAAVATAISNGTGDRFFVDPR